MELFAKIKLSRVQHKSFMCCGWKFPPLQLISLQFVWPIEAVELKKYVVKFALKIDDTDNFISMSTWISNVDRLKFDSFAYKIEKRRASNTTTVLL